MLLSFGDSDAEDTILEAGRDSIVVDTRREVEASGELADTALGEPILGMVGFILLDHLLSLLGLWFRNLIVVVIGVKLGLVLILDSGVVGVLALAARCVTALGDGTARLGVLDEASWRSTGSVGALSLAADEHGLRLGKLNLNILLLHAGELAMELVGLTSLTDIKFWLPVGKAAATSALSLTRVAVKVIEKAEEGSERGVGVVVEVAREESHCDCLIVW